MGSCLGCSSCGGVYVGVCGEMAAEDEGKDYLFYTVVYYADCVFGVVAGVYLDDFIQNKQ